MCNLVLQTSITRYQRIMSHPVFGGHIKVVRTDKKAEQMNINIPILKITMSCSRSILNIIRDCFIMI